MTNSNLLTRVTDTIQTYNMLSQGDSVIVALSGGADSVCLLSVLSELREEWNLTLEAAHVNHGIRGEEADRDEAFCRDLCETMGIPLRVKHANVPALCKETGESEETCGRRIRYEFFASLVEELGMTEYPSVKVATAHNADDTVETLLFNLARGAGLNGLASIPPVRDYIIRPLIDSPRADIETYLSEKGLSHVEDSTNGDTGYARNRIRHKVVPELCSVNAGAVSNMSRLMGLLREDAGLLDRLAEELRTAAQVPDRPDVYYADVLLNGEPALRRRALARILRNATGLAPEHRHIAAAEALLSTGGHIQVLTGSYVTVKDNLLTCVTCLAVPVDTDADFSCDLAEQVTIPTGTFAYRLYTAEEAQQQWTVYEMSNRSDLLDFHKLQSAPVSIRNRRPGDTYEPRFRHLKKTLKHLFTEASIPVERRNQLVIMTSGDTIAWVEEFGASAEYMVTGETSCIMQIYITREEEGNF